MHGDITRERRKMWTWLNHFQPAECLEVPSISTRSSSTKRAPFAQTKSTTMQKPISL
jgi:hypothetical protein